MASSRIISNPEQCGGKPCIRGMRSRVRDGLELYAACLSSEQILADYPDLEPEHLSAALDDAAAGPATTPHWPAIAALTCWFSWVLRDAAHGCRAWIDGPYPTGGPSRGLERPGLGLLLVGRATDQRC